ncbi:MAG: DUF86 domain-containing protein [Armatimonadota bacterium]
MSSKRSDLAYLYDMLESIQRVQEYVQGYDYEAFMADQKTRDAVIRNLEVIGEAVRKLSRSLRARYPQVEWKSIAGFRGGQIHDHFALRMCVRSISMSRRAKSYKATTSPPCGSESLDHRSQSIIGVAGDASK